MRKSCVIHELKMLFLYIIMGLHDIYSSGSRDTRDFFGYRYPRTRSSN
jgi:hypothetical protein